MAAEAQPTKRDQKLWKIIGILLLSYPIIDLIGTYNSTGRIEADLGKWGVVCLTYLLVGVFISLFSKK